MTTDTEEKRQQLLAFIERVLEPEPAVQAVVGIGSIANGLARSDSDIDAIVFFDPMDWYIIPAEFIWHPRDGTFHSIFIEDRRVKEEGFGLDCQRLDLGKWADPSFAWPEGRKAELVDGWIAYDRNGDVSRLIDSRTAYPEWLRQDRLDEAVIWLDQHLADDGPNVRWQSLGTVIAHDRLQVAFRYLAQALFAYNRRWQPWRNRQMSAMLRLPWLPNNFAKRVLVATNAPGLDYEAYLTRANQLSSLFDDLLSSLIADGFYSSLPVDQAFIRAHDEPGFAWNMDDWNSENLKRVNSTVSDDTQVKL